MAANPATKTTFIHNKCHFLREWVSHKRLGGIMLCFVSRAFLVDTLTTLKCCKQLIARYISGRTESGTTNVMPAEEGEVL